ncbi:hypothetical protein VaNZ11_007393, partial [Volvox africanus]
MNDLDKDPVVDFTGHFLKRSSLKGHKENQGVSREIKVRGQLAEQRCIAEGKGRSSGSESKRKSEVPNPKEHFTHLENSSASHKKRKTVSEDETGGRTKAKCASKGLWPFRVDYNDHFESPLQAVQDIEPVLQLLSVKLKKSKSSLTVYDPYFCQGGIRQHYEQLGFKNFIHRNRDFYKDVDSGNVPSYDILVTNPPYSSDHKERILEFCLRSGKPWALLLPNYVATKAYFSELLDSMSTPAAQRPFFLTPPARYNYEHPEGTGHAESPFFSIWYIGLGEHTETIYKACKARLEPQSNDSSIQSAAAAGLGGVW